MTISNSLDLTQMQFKLLSRPHVSMCMKHSQLVYLWLNACLLQGCLEDCCHQVICQGILKTSPLCLHRNFDVDYCRQGHQQKLLLLLKQYPANRCAQSTNDDHIVRG